MKNYICTIKELSEKIAKCILKENPCETVFDFIDFSVLPCGYDGKTDPKVIASGAEGWYGIRRIDTGFDDDGLTLCANYYGGGNPCFCYFDSDCSYEGIVKTVCLVIQRSLCLEGPNINGDTVLIAEDYHDLSHRCDCNGKGKIVSTCPNCGNSTWLKLNAGEFECLACEYVYEPEDMGSEFQKDNKESC